MNRLVRKYVLLAAAVVIALSVVSHLVLFATGPSLRFGPEDQIAEAAVGTLTSPRTAIDFAPLDEPRRLPEFRFTDGDGRGLSMADFRGRLVVLNIWATWCAPCRREMPSLDRLQAAFAGAEFDVVALSVDRKGLAAVRAFYAALAIKSLDIYVANSSSLTRALGVIGLPTTLLVDRSGRELGRLVGPAEWDSPELMAKLRRYLERPTIKTAGS